MPPLTSKQRAHLRALAHGLKPVVHVGSDGVTERVLSSVLDAFNTRELLKIRVLEACPIGSREVADRSATALADVHVVQTIGRTAVLYRPHPDEPSIRLPVRSGTP